MTTTSRSLRKTDLNHIWHPYTNMDQLKKQDFPIIERASGANLFTTDGRRILDAIASWWCVNLGHSHPRLINALTRQIHKLQHCILGGLSHEPVIKLSEKLTAIAPKNLNRVFYAGDGSSAVEAALKIALQYWHNQGEKKRTEFISLADGYHGDTLGAIGVGYVPRFHAPFADKIRRGLYAESPDCSQCPEFNEEGDCRLRCFDSMEQLITANHLRTAAVIVEPLCQGAAGVRIYPRTYLKKLRKICDCYSLPLIFDEIAVGFGRTGKMFAGQTAGVEPDIMTVGKGLTNGYLPMSAVLVSDRIYESFTNYDNGDVTLYHGHTFTGNPVTSALALEVLNIYESERIHQNLTSLQEILNGEIKELAEVLSGSFAQTLGMIGVVRVKESAGGKERADRIAKKALEAGVFIRPLGASLYVWPPLTVSEGELREIFCILKDAARITLC